MVKVRRFEKSAIEYRITGKKHSETLVFLHGLGADLSQFEIQHDYFDKEFRVISVNLRGHGKSEILGRPSLEEFELSAMANDVLQLLDALNINQVHLVGNSMGGNVGYEILKSNPNMLTSFTSFGTTAQLHTPKSTLTIMKYSYKLLSTKAISYLAKFAGQTTASQAKIQKMMSKVHKPTLRYILPNIASFNYLNVLRNSKPPCLIIQGKLDQSINKVIKSTIAEFEKRGNFKLVEMEYAGHFANLDVPCAFNKILGDFIEAVTC